MASLPANSALPTRRILSVSELNRAARGLLEGGFPLLWVEGEISNLAQPGSGHLYFSLKDSQAQVRCALFRNRGMLLRFKPANGMKVLVRGRVSLYEPRGDFQLLVESMEDAGHGALQRAFEALKERLAKEGLFDSALKRALPEMPKTIGVITSPTGAAIRDILSVVRRRHPLAKVIVYPVPVQGEGAAARIAAMLGLASRRGECEVLILARGGGSLEDLWAFNEEPIARAIRASSIPVVSGIGHEIDFTIADFAADLRAPTPSAAAELLVPDAGEIRRALDHVRARLDQWIRHRLHALAQRGDHALARLRARHPRQRLRLGSERLAHLHARLQRLHPAGALERRADVLRRGIERLRTQLAYRLQARELHLSELARALNAVSPLATLQRGYAILIDRDSGRIVRDIKTSRRVKHFSARLADGEIPLIHDPES
ncbi:MAG TPA: exodeoxyribonuclease VII large subunit [Rudaea sp.]|nr:exodeoxyribonuclease VII large subunit [Rudaea sp.]